MGIRDYVKFRKTSNSFHIGIRISKFKKEKYFDHGRFETREAERARFVIFSFGSNKYHKETVWD